MISQKKESQRIRTIIDGWRSDEPDYEFLKETVGEFLRLELSSLEVVPRITERTKLLTSMIKTALRKGKLYAEINDKLGFRIVCHLKSELRIIDQFVRDNFIVRHFESKAASLEYDQVGYQSDHYDVSINCALPRFSSLEHLSAHVFEIQVRTISENAWAEIAHSLVYKSDEAIPKELKRRIYRLSSLFEICDDEFESVNTMLVNRPEGEALAVIQATEGTFFRVARRDFDKHLSLEVIQAMLAALPQGRPFVDLLGEFRAFLNQYDDRIGKVYVSRKEELNTDLYLSQPEILFLWYLIERYPYPTMREWNLHFDPDDLATISVMWGTPLPT